MFDNVLKIAKRNDCEFVQIIHTNREITFLKDGLEIENRISSDDFICLQVSKNRKFGQVFLTYSALGSEFVIENMIKLAIETSEELNVLDEFIRHKNFHISLNNEYKNVDDIRVFLKEQKEEISQKHKCNVLEMKFTNEFSRINIINTNNVNISYSNNRNNLSILAKSDDINNNEISYSEINNFSLDEKLEQLLMKDNFFERLNYKEVSLMPTDAKSIKFSHRSASTLVRWFLSMFDAGLVLAERSGIDKDWYLKNQFSESFSLVEKPQQIKIDEDYIDFDCEGVLKQNKYIIKEGRILDFLNNIKTKNVLGGTAGNCSYNLEKNQFEKNYSDIEVIIAEEPQKMCELYVEDINLVQSMFDVSTGNANILCIGKIAEEELLKKYSININLVSSFKTVSATQSKLNYNGILTPEIIISII